MEYSIRKNDQFNSLEITFDGKPSEAVRNALKSLRFRWHGVKKLWYGYSDEEKVRAAIDGITEKPVTEKPVYEITPTEAYMGAVGFVGSNAGKRLYGAELAQAIREAIKGDGIKGVTVSKDTYSMGQSITLTVKITDSDLLTVDQYVANTNIFDFAFAGWITDTDEGRDVDQYSVNNWDSEKQERVHRELAKRELGLSRSGRRMVNHYYIDNCDYFTDAFKVKLHRLVLITQSFNYNDSNSMVDYYDVGFHLDVYTKYCN